MKDVALGYLDATIEADDRALTVNAELMDLGRDPESDEDERLKLMKLRQSLGRERDRAYRNYERIWWSLPESERYAVNERGGGEKFSPGPDIGVTDSGPAPVTHPRRDVMDIEGWFPEGRLL